MELAVPDIPDSITDPQRRADFALQHFWDEADFTDSRWAVDSATVEQNFSNFAYLIPYGTEEAAKSAVATLLKKAAANKSAFNLMLYTADKYLFDPNSPMLNEKTYSYFLTSLITMPQVSSTKKELYKYQLEAIRLNAPGTTANDFDFEDRKEKKMSLLAMPHTKYTVLGFYDPDCDHCKEIIAAMRDSDILNKAIKNHEVQIAMIYSGDNRALWDETKDSMPLDWTIGYDLTGVEDSDLYINRASPTLYLLDKDFKVLAKDIPVQALLSGLDPDSEE